MLTLVIPSPVYTPTSVSSWLPVHGITPRYNLGIVLHIKTSFNCVLFILYIWAILVLLKKHNFKAKYDLFLCSYDRLCILREFDNLPYKTLKIDESEAEKVEKKKSSKFVEFGRLFVRKIRQIRLYISVLVIIVGR
jgi:hypothetical protein